MSLSSISSVLGRKPSCLGQAILPHHITVRMEKNLLDSLRTTTGSIGAVDLDTDSYLEINGVEITGFSVFENDANGVLTSAINAAFEETGVSAEVNAEGQLVLTAEDGLNIEFKVQNLGATL